MSWVRSAPVTVTVELGWEQALANAMEKTVGLLAEGRKITGVTTTALTATASVVAVQAPGPSFGRRGDEQLTQGVLVTVYGE